MLADLPAGADRVFLPARGKDNNSIPTESADYCYAAVKGFFQGQTDGGTWIEPVAAAV